MKDNPKTWTKTLQTKAAKFESQLFGECLAKDLGWADSKKDREKGNSIRFRCESAVPCDAVNAAQRSLFMCTQIRAVKVTVCVCMCMGVCVGACLLLMQDNEFMYALIIYNSLSLDYLR